ncbi:MAG TPA: FAD-linked oxidase C-terminal domain-containing protein [Chloroflexota bacterium]|nr:FAD-linked oxidase C-terminal domain-containing protein [Chloroflexota bacterium]
MAGDVERAHRALEQALAPDRVTMAPEDMVVYSYDGTWIVGRPQIAVTPLNAEEVAATVRVARDEGIPIVPRGAASGLAGGSVPLFGGIVVNMTRMNSILDIDRVNMTVVTQPGVVTATLQAAVEREGLFYPPDPASLKQSTIGGNLSTSAGGPRCLKYGTTRDYALGLQVVLPSGEIMRTGARTAKNSSGYDLTHLFVGSEGTLGLITEGTLRLIPVPRARRTVMADFADVSAAANSVTDVLGAGIVPCAMELMDRTTLTLVEEYLKAGINTNAGALILIEIDGDEEVVPRQADEVAAICNERAISVRLARDAAEADGLWNARRSVAAAFGQLRPNRLGEDIAVPRSKIPEAVERIRDIGAEHDVTIAIFGHAGDGNLHPNLLVDLRDEDETRRTLAAADEIFRLAIEMGGVISGEHGIGIMKREYLVENLDPLALATMRGIKQLLDPTNIMNPGKVLAPL